MKQSSAHKDNKAKVHLPTLFSRTYQDPKENFFQDKNPIFQ